MLASTRSSLSEQGEGGVGGILIPGPIIAVSSTYPLHAITFNSSYLDPQQSCLYTAISIHSCVSIPPFHSCHLCIPLPSSTAVTSVPLSLLLQFLSSHYLQISPLSPLPSFKALTYLPLSLLQQLPPLYSSSFI